MKGRKLPIGTLSNQKRLLLLELNSNIDFSVSAPAYNMMTDCHLNGCNDFIHRNQQDPLRAVIIVDQGIFPHHHHHSTAIVPNLGCPNVLGLKLPVASNINYAGQDFWEL